MEIGETIYVTTREELRKWFEKNHKSKKEIWLIQYKKATQKPSINFADAVEEAMCFGWTGSRAEWIPLGVTLCSCSTP